MSLRKVKAFVGLNIGMVAGCFGALFVLPPNTPLRTWLIISVLFICGVNVWVYKKTRLYVGEEKQPLPQLFWLFVVFSCLSLLVRFLLR